MALLFRLKCKCKLAIYKNFVTIKEIYRSGAKVGDGGLADAIRYEIKTGKFVGGKSHIQKGTERLKNLERIFDRESLTKQERKIVEDLINDLRRALGGK